MPETSMAKRPWQGTALGVLMIVAVILMFFAASGMLAMRNFNPPSTTVPAEINSVMKAMIIPMVMFYVFVAILSALMARGFFKGQKWQMIAIVTELIFLSLAFLGGVVESVTKNNLSENLIDFGFMVILIGFCIYLVNACWSHPFYVKK